MNSLADHPHLLTITATAIPIFSWFEQVGDIFTATTAILATCWYIWLFFNAWRGRNIKEPAP